LETFKHDTPPIGENLVSQVKEYRIENRCSLQEASRTVKRQAVLASIEQASSLGDVKRCLAYVVQRLLWWPSVW
jgi:hypothetical protein